MKTQAHIDYSGRMRRLATRHPLQYEMYLHIGYWMFAFLVLSVIIYLERISMIGAFSLNVDLKLFPFALNSVIMGILFGAGTAMTEHSLEKNVRGMALGKSILLKTVISLIILTIVFLFRRYVLYPLFVAPSTHYLKQMNSNSIWHDLFYIIVIYTAVMSVIFHFIKQVNKKFGPGILLPLLLGRYRHPKEEERIFMFMDLKSSTTLAETMGHLNYSCFIRDAFMDINHVLPAYDAEIYQYVGDEIVVSWNTDRGMKNAACVKFYFACQEELKKKSEYYLNRYGHVPFFKASLHVGKVIAVEIGDIKREIAYHGDTINTAARIQSMCNEYQKNLLVSDALVETGNLHDIISTDYLGDIMLKGKTTPVGILSVEG